MKLKDSFLRNTRSIYYIFILLIFLLTSALQGQQVQIVTFKLLANGKPLSGVNVQTSVGGKVSRYASNASGDVTFTIPVNEVLTIKTTQKGFRSDWIVITSTEPVVKQQLDAFNLELIPVIPNVALEDPDKPVLYYIIQGGKIQQQDDQPDFAKANSERASLAQTVKERLEQMQGKAMMHRKEAEKAFAEGSYNNARDQYRRALETFPADIVKYYYDDTTVRDAIAECTRILDQQQKTNENFQLAIKTADQFLKDNDLENALKVYQQSLQFQPSSPYALDQIEKVREMMKGQQANRMIYDLLMASASQSERDKALDRALEEYRQAQALFPADKEANLRIVELEKAIAERDRQYNLTIAQADKLVQGQNYEDALATYRNARRIHPNETYASGRIDEITAQLAARKSRDDADRESAQVDRALAKEEEARLKALAEQEKRQQQAQTDFDKKLQQAGLSLDQKRVEEAERLMEEANKIADQHKLDKAPLDALARRVDQVRDNLMVTAAYDKAMSDGKAAYAAQKLQDAAGHFARAVDIQSTEEAKKLLAEVRGKLERSQEIESGYQNAMANGRSAMDGAAWAQATRHFEDALSFKPADNEATSLVQRSRTEQRRTVLIQEGEAAESAGDIGLAIEKFKEAWPLPPADSRLRERTEALESQYAEQLRSRKARYDALIAEADGKWQKKVMDEAIVKYREASALRPAEEYPKRMIREITTYLEERLVMELNREELAISDRKEQRFTFKPLNVKQRKSTYVLISAKNTSGQELKVYLNYGQGNSKNGGIVFKAPASEQVQDFIIRVSSQYRWYDLNNDWIGIYPEGGPLEITVVQLASGE